MQWFSGARGGLQREWPGFDPRSGQFPYYFANCVPMQRPRWKRTMYPQRISGHASHKIKPRAKIGRAPWTWVNIAVRCHAKVKKGHCLLGQHSQSHLHIGTENPLGLLLYTFFILFSIMILFSLFVKLINYFFYKL